MAGLPGLRSVNSLIGAEALVTMSYQPLRRGRSRGADAAQQMDAAQQAALCATQAAPPHQQAHEVAVREVTHGSDLARFEHARSLLREHGQLGAAREQVEAQLASGRLGKGATGSSYTVRPPPAMPGQHRLIAGYTKLANPAAATRH